MASSMSARETRGAVETAATSASNSCKLMLRTSIAGCSGTDDVLLNCIFICEFASEFGVEVFPSKPMTTKGQCMKRLILAALTIAFVSLPAFAGSKTTLSGADFLSACTRADLEWISFCNGYVQAIVDTDESLCIPAGTTRAGIVDAVVSVFIAKPALQHSNAATAVHAILTNIFRCP